MLRKNSAKKLKDKILVLVVLILLIPIQISNSEISKIPETKGFIIKEKNSLIAMTSMVSVENHSYKTLNSFEHKKAVEILLKEIIKRESGGNPKVCNSNGCIYGQGLTQIIPSSVEFCEKGLKKEINPFNSEDNLLCARYLLEHGGIWHWEKYSGPYVSLLKDLNLYEEFYLLN